MPFKTVGRGNFTKNGRTYTFKGDFAQKQLDRMEEIEKEENIILDSQNGCKWCYRPRMDNSLYCCEEHQSKYEFHNGKVIE